MNPDPEIPGLLEATRTGSDRFSNMWRAMFDHEPTMMEIADVQTKLGYPPQGYGGPNNVRYYNNQPFRGKENCYIVFWDCSNSCD